MQKEDLIYRFFENQLSTEEQTEFDALLKNDVEFQNEVNFRKKIKKAITVQERENLKIKLQSFENKTKENNSKKNYWLIAGVFLLFFGGLALYQSHQTSIDELFASYYQTYPNTVAPTVRGEQEENLKSKAFQAYDAGKYQDAMSLFTTIYESGSEDYALFYKALSLMELDKYEESIATFNAFDARKNSDFLPYIKWYKALAHLKLNQKKEAIAVLKQLSSSENPQKEMAQKLLSELE